MIGLPDSAAAVLDLFEGLELGGEERGQDLGGQVAGTDVHPPVPSDDAAQEVAAVGTLVPDDLRSGMQAHVVDDERASLTTLHVLGFVEALGGEGSEGSETLSAVRPAKPMRIVLDQADPVAFGDAVEGVHVAADARVVHGPSPARCPTLIAWRR